MPGTVAGPSGHFQNPPDLALIFAGTAILTLTLAAGFSNRDQRAASFAQPTVVEAVVVDPHLRTGGGGHSCQPQFRYEIQSAVRVTQLPTSNPRSCYDEGQIVPLTVDGANPDRISDLASERYARQVHSTSLGLGGLFLVGGGLWRWQRLGGAAKSGA